LKLENLEMGVTAIEAKVFNRDKSFKGTLNININMRNTSQMEPQEFFADSTTDDASVDAKPKPTFFDKEDLPGFIPKPRFGAKVPIED